MVERNSGENNNTLIVNLGETPPWQTPSNGWRQAVGPNWQIRRICGSPR